MSGIGEAENAITKSKWKSKMLTSFFRRVMISIKI
jgi:hypothetical protein